MDVKSSANEVSLLYKGAIEDIIRERKSVNNDLDQIIKMLDSGKNNYNESSSNLDYVLETLCQAKETSKKTRLPKTAVARMEALISLIEYERDLRNAK